VGNGVEEKLVEEMKTAQVPPPHTHPGVELGANLKSISYRCHLFEVAFLLGWTRETIYLPLDRLQGGTRELHRGHPEHPTTLRCQLSELTSLGNSVFWIASL